MKMTHTDIVRILRTYGSVDGDFVADQLRLSMTEVRSYLDALENAGVIERRGEMVMLAGEERSSAEASLKAHY